MSLLYSAIDPADSGRIVTARKALIDILPQASTNTSLQSILFHRAVNFTEIDVIVDGDDATESRARLIGLARSCLDYVDVIFSFYRLIKR